MKAQETRISSLFFRGDYREVLSLTVDVGNISKEVFQWVIGALCFAGRKEEAEALYVGTRASGDGNSRAACRFFLGVAFCRHGNYEKARAYFAKNLWLGRRAKGQLGFFAWQGLSFYRYFSASFRRSEMSAFKALTQATLLSFGYGRALALDLIGHSLVQQGKLAAGLARLSEARKAAEALGNGGLAQSITLSALVYRAQYGLEPWIIVRNLKRALAGVAPQNSYALSNLLLELANQHLLRGRVGSALAALNEASPLIYGSQHQRHGHLLALRFAEIAYRRGEFASALHAVRMQRALLDKRHDLLNLLMALGLEIKLLSALRMDTQVPPLLAELSRLTQRSDRSVSRAYLDRQMAGSSVAAAEDRLATVFMLLGKPNAPANILRSGYLAFMGDSLGLPPGTSWIVASKSEILVLDKGEVARHRWPSSRPAPLLLRALQALANHASAGPRSKEELIREIWGYASYHPMRHDALLYQTIARLRETLGAHEYLVASSGEGYHLRTGFGFVLLNERKPTTSTAEKAASVISDDTDPELSERQIRILRWLGREEFLAVRDCQKRFRVSSMTLKRDFSDLVRQGWVKRVGRARATRYALQSGFGSPKTNRRDRET